VTIAPLAIVVPVLGACVLMAGGKHVPRVVADLAALAVAAATTVLSALLLAHVWHGPTHVYWFGGWHPRPHGIALGIDLAIEPVGAGAATFAALLMTCALLYAQRYFQAMAPFFHVLMLVFLAGMVGFSLSGDLFNMFVFFELMSVPAYALTGYKVEERGPLQGALNFAISNSLGAFLTLSGIALLYGRTGALNLAQIGESLAARHADGLVIVALVLVLTGFLVKAAAVPFHFWLADAHATAPVPVCVLFSGIMVQLGLLGVARVYWAVFSGRPELHAGGVVHVLLVLGVVTAVVGGVMAFVERHLKRLLAFSTISHTGMFLIGLALLRAHGTAGAALFVLAHGFTKASLFMFVGIVGHRLGSLDEVELHGRGRRMWATGFLFAVGALALASLPPFGAFAGKSLIEEAASEDGYWWVAPLFVIVSALAAGAILRAAVGIFLGLGEARPPAIGEEEGETREEAQAGAAETEGGSDRTPAVMFLPAVALLAAGLAVAFLPHLDAGFERAAVRFQDRPAYAAQVLHAHVVALPNAHVTAGPKPVSYLWGAASVIGAIAAAFAALYLPRLSDRLSRLREIGVAAARALREWHSGHIGDYATWLVVGVVAIGWALAAVIP
jgi:multicomponent Na+:H+ antiporter subunit D